jgi:ABC-type nitrate/sulfonate/bicarbonate transport system permease component
MSVEAIAPAPSLTSRLWHACVSGRERLLIGGGAILVFLAVWEIVAATALVDPLFISSPSRIVAVGRELVHEEEFWNDVRVSAAEFVFGYLWAIAIGIPLGLLTGWFRRLHYMIGPLIDILNAVPRVTFLPLLVLWFGIGIWSKFAVVFLGAVIPITIAAFSGVRTNEARYLRVARSFNASQLKIFTSIILPGTLPFVFTGLKYGSGRALLGVVVGELYAATAGVGHMIAEAGNAFQTDVVLFGVLLFTVAGLVTAGILDRLERYFDKWRPEGVSR